MSNIFFLSLIEAYNLTIVLFESLSKYIKGIISSFDVSIVSLNFLPLVDLDSEKL